MYIVVDYTVELPLSRQEPSLVDFILHIHCYKHSKTLIRKQVGSLSNEVYVLYSPKLLLLGRKVYFKTQRCGHTFMLCNSAFHAQITLQIKQL